MKQDIYTIIKNHFNHYGMNNKLNELDFIYQEIANRMITKLEYLMLEPKLILDIGSGLNIDFHLLKNKFTQAKLIKLDLAITFLKNNSFSSSWLRKLLYKNIDTICANGLNLPIMDNSINMVWSNLVLPYIVDLEHFFKEIFRVLDTNGCFFISGLGVDSFKQLRELGLNTYNFPDMHVIGDILVKLGFSDPVTDVDYITLEYDDINQLLIDVKTVGCGSVVYNKYLGKISYNKIKNKCNNYGVDNKFLLTLEVFYAHAWKGEKAKMIIDGTDIIRFDYLDKKRNPKKI
jgi:malonyl-CoA O-methyltransferase